MTKFYGTVYNVKKEAKDGVKNLRNVLLGK